MEEVGTGALAVGGILFLQILVCLVLVPLDQVGFRQHAGETAGPLGGKAVHHLGAVLQHVVIIAVIEAALEQIVHRKVLEALVLDGLPEPLLGLAEAACRIVHISLSIAGRSGVG